MVFDEGRVTVLNAPDVLRDAVYRLHFWVVWHPLKARWVAFERRPDWWHISSRWLNHNLREVNFFHRWLVSNVSRNIFDLILGYWSCRSSWRFVHVNHGEANIIIILRLTSFIVIPRCDSSCKFRSHRWTSQDIVHWLFLRADIVPLTQFECLNYLEVSELLLCCLVCVIWHPSKSVYELLAKVHVNHVIWFFPSSSGLGSFH